jgi:hypothetical protein
MQNFQKIAITVAFSFTCFSVPVLGASASDRGESARGSKKAAPGSAMLAAAQTKVLPGSTTGGGDGASTGGTVGIGVDRGIELPTKPDWAGSFSTQIKALTSQFRKEQQDLLKAYREMLKQAKEVGKEERDKVREQFRVQRDELFARQKELKEEYKRRFEEFRLGHQEHLDVIDAAKERAKEAVRERRGHGDR